MLSVKIVLYPYGERPGKLLKEIEIINDGTGSVEMGNYIIRVDGVPVSSIHSYPRKKGYIGLLEKALLNLVNIEKNKPSSEKGD